MARELVRKTIDDIEYQIQELPISTRLKLLPRFGRIGGDFMGNLMAAQKGGSMDKLFSSFFNNLSDTDMVEIPLIILSTTMPLLSEGIGAGKLLNNKELFELYFHDKGMAHLFKVLRVVGEVQFGDFLGENGVLSSLFAMMTGSDQA